ncbi:dethiobiotin synthase [Algoriella sp.]|uniref:dethiobiotin synthase n=1 Tax=Algoriella sp. TaxID=1872434 RepID=UPI001AFDCF6B|nr:dethiobiotin synthase [Algoriella sp.]MBO6211514.1 dethiobiotin synthase [Algoriella sp.]
MKTDLFITGIGTGIGKTVTSAVLTQYFKADYWKPIQSGDLDQSDSLTVKSMIDNDLIIHPERFKLNYPASPHQSAAMENIEINLDDFQLPNTENSLLVEGAGGLFVPLNNYKFMIDLIAKFNLKTVLVVRDYLGCINHTLLSIEALQHRNLEIAYVVLNGNFEPATKDVLIKNIPKTIQIIELPELNLLSKETINKVSKSLKIK